MINEALLRENLSRLYGESERQLTRYKEGTARFIKLFGSGGEIIAVSSPGRSEISGNHTDHNGGKVIASAVEADTVAFCRRREDGQISIKSELTGNISVDIGENSVRQKEKYSSTALVRGISAYFSQNSCGAGGFDAYIISDVLPGSGISSSAAFEICVCSVFNHLFNGGELSGIDLALAGKYAENRYFGKPSGLMDQLACALGGFVYIDFADADNPLVESLSLDIDAAGFSMYIINCRGSHADLNEEYASIPEEMKSVAAFFGADRLCGISTDQLLANAAQIRKKSGDRALQRAIHFAEECGRVEQQRRYIKENRVQEFLDCVRQSGISSACLLQNIYPQKDAFSQPLSLALGVCSTFGEKVFARVHGGGFAGTILAFAQKDIEKAFTGAIDSAFGKGSAKKHALRQTGAACVRLQ